MWHKRSSSWLENQVSFSKIRASLALCVPYCSFRVAAFVAVERIAWALESEHMRISSLLRSCFPVSRTCCFRGLLLTARLPQISSQEDVAVKNLTCPKLSDLPARDLGLRNWQTSGKACSERCLKATKCCWVQEEGAFYQPRRRPDWRALPLPLGALQPARVIFSTSAGSLDNELMLGMEKLQKTRHLTAHFKAEMTTWNIYAKLFKSSQLFKTLKKKRIKVMYT